MQNLNLENLKNKYPVGVSNVMYSNLITQAECHTLLCGHPFATLIQLASSPPSPASGRRTKTSSHTCRRAKLPSPDVGRRVWDEGRRAIADFCVREREIDLVGFHGI
jgi:hypothetical protein